jgi:hypothetical protein
MTEYPRMFRVRQKFETQSVADVAGSVRAELARLDLAARIRPGQRVAITAGSRGIADGAVVVRAMVEHVRSLGAEPLIVAAMGSHGGATSQGQRQVLQANGVTEAFVGCPISTSMETVVVCQTAEGFPVHFDRAAFESDHVLVCNRIKPHTRFIGDIESGLMKMMLIGLGKCEGAIVYHRAIQDYSFGQIIRSVAAEVMARCRIAGGVAIVENALDRTARIEAIAPADFEAREKELLALAKRWMARLPFDAADLLLIDEIGKDISGTGLDTNVVGRKYDDHRAREHERPKVKWIALRDLTEATHGNAVGLGIAEFCKTSLLRKTDVPTVRLNAITANHVTAAMLPLDYETDREILDVALGSVGLTEPPRAKLLWIRNTLALEEVECSAAYWDEAQRRDDLEVLTPLRPLPLDASGNLPARMTAWGNT